MALSEDFEDIEKHTSLVRCGFPYIEDIPDDIVLNFTETPREFGPFGAGGCGEGPLTSPHAAIVNAIYHACGVRVDTLPVTPEAILRGLDATAARASRAAAPEGAA